jgi:hypothetical protein
MQTAAQSQSIPARASPVFTSVSGWELAGPSLVPIRSLRWEGVEAKNLGIGADPGDREHCWPHHGVKRSEDQLCRNAPRPVRPRWAARLANRGRESAKQVVSGTANHQPFIAPGTSRCRKRPANSQACGRSRPRPGLGALCASGRHRRRCPHNRPHDERTGTSFILRIGGAGEFAHSRAAPNLRPGEKIAPQAFCGQSPLYRAGQS